VTEVKLKKMSVLLESEEFQRFESYCDKNGFKKSTLAARLIRQHLDREGFKNQPQVPLLAKVKNRGRA